MKKILIFALVLAGFVSCNVIKPDDRYLQMEDIDDSGDRNVLLIDFTGWKCVNCPEAAKVANGLVSRFGSRMIVVSMHPEGISFTDPGTAGPKFATKEAMEYLNAFGGSNSLPLGVVDGQQFDGSYFLNPEKWASAVTERLEVGTQYSINMKASINECSLTVQKEGSDNRNVNVVLWLLEDSIIAPQATTSSMIEEYAHRHVFRKCLNGSDIWGEPAAFESGVASISVSYRLPDLEGRNFVIVAVAFDAVTHEVLQAEEVELQKAGDGSFNVIYDGKELQDGDTVDITEIERDFVTQMTFEGYFNSTYTETHDFFIYEDRKFDISEYILSMCVFGECQMDINNGTWGPYGFEGKSENLFQSHVEFINNLNDEVTLETDYTFTDGVTSKVITVRFHYVPEEAPE